MCLIGRCRAPQNGYTPLLLASGHGHAAVVEQLLAAGADIEASDSVSGKRGVGCQVRMCRVEGRWQHLFLKILSAGLVTDAKTEVMGFCAW